MLATVVDSGDLFSVLWTSLAAGTGICVFFSLALLGAARGAELRRDGNIVAATIYFGIGLIGIVFVVAAVVFGIVVMTQK